MYSVWHDFDGDDDFLIGTYATIEEAESVVEAERKRGCNVYITRPLTDTERKRLGL